MCTKNLQRISKTEIFFWMRLPCTGHGCSVCCWGRRVHGFWCTTHSQFTACHNAANVLYKCAHSRRVFLRWAHWRESTSVTDGIADIGIQKHSRTSHQALTHTHTHTRFFYFMKNRSFHGQNKNKTETNCKNKYYEIYCAWLHVWGILSCSSCIIFILNYSIAECKRKVK